MVELITNKIIRVRHGNLFPYRKDYSETNVLNDYLAPTGTLSWSVIKSKKFKRLKI